ncbi:hypothetical protein FIBSPDRAFT_853909, partial [Athelia psychrophila]
MSHTILEPVRFCLLPPSLCPGSVRFFSRWERELTMKDQAIREGKTQRYMDQVGGILVLIGLL